MNREDIRYYFGALRNAWMVIKLIRNFPRFWANRLGWLHEPETVYTLWSGLKIKIRNGTTDFYILREVLGRQEYFQAGLSIGSTDTVVEIGGHIGLFTVAAARRAVQGRVLVFEPNPENCRLLRENICLNNFSHVTVVNKAVAAETGRRTFYLDRANTGGHSLYQSPEAGQSLTVKSISWSDVRREYGIKHVAYLKMDCEGAEHEILTTFTADDWPAMAQIALETHVVGNRSGDVIEQMLQQHGFEVQRRRASQVEAVSSGAMGGTGYLLLARRKG